MASGRKTKTSSIKATKKIGDNAVRRGTGKTWDQWIKILDKSGCAKMNHKQIVEVVSRKDGVGPWWQQMVTVGYEQARGLRDLHQKPGGYEISGSKTVDVPVGELFDAWNDPKRRRLWLGARQDDLVVRKATRPKSLRITWCDGRTNVDVNLYSKGPGRSYVSLNHGKLASAKEASLMKQYWAGTLQKLKAVMNKPGT